MENVKRTFFKRRQFNFAPAVEGIAFEGLKNIITLTPNYNTDEFRQDTPQ
jgi:hypothetical protein